MVSPDPFQHTNPLLLVGRELAPASPAKLCSYCLTKTSHPRLGRGETYVCGYKPYRCEVCNYSTTTKGNLAIHQQSDKHLNNMQELEQAAVQRTNKLTETTLPKPGDNPDLSSSVQCESSLKLSHCSPAGSPANPDGRSSLHTMLSVRRDQHMHGVQYPFPIELPATVPSFGVYGSGEHTIPLFDIAQPASDIPTTEQFLAKLTESSPYPLACQVCCAFTTDKLDVLLRHAERNRVPIDQDPLTSSLTTHTGGVWLCRLCVYKSPLKANFQLHCKTEKHAQRLSFLLHVSEGGPANQLRVLAPVNPRPSGLESLSVGVIEPVQPGNCGHVFELTQNGLHIKHGLSLSSTTQLACLACNVFTTSVHKFRIHCQCPRHLQAVQLFHNLVAARSDLWNRLATFSLAYVDLIRKNCDSEGSELTSSQGPSKQIVDNRFGQALYGLSRLLTRLRIGYSCRCDCTVAISHPMEKRKTFINLIKALSHWHSPEHQQMLVHQKPQPTINETIVPNLLCSADLETFEVIWRLGDLEGSVDELPNLFASLMVPDCVNRREVAHQMSQNNQEITEDASDRKSSTHSADRSSASLHSMISPCKEDLKNLVEPFAYDVISDTEQQTSQDSGQLSISANVRELEKSDETIVGNTTESANQLRYDSDARHTTGAQTELCSCKVDVVESQRDGSQSDLVNITQTGEYFDKNYSNQIVPRIYTSPDRSLGKHDWNLPLQRSQSAPALNSSLPDLLKFPRCTSNLCDSISIEEESHLRPKSVDVRLQTEPPGAYGNSGKVALFVDDHDRIESNTVKSLSETETSLHPVRSMINPKPDLHSPCFSEPSILLPGLLDFKHPGVLDPVAELTVRCQFCVCEIPSSKLLVHMAMHFMQLSKTLSSKETIPEGERLGELEDSVAHAISEPTWPLNLTVENFYIMFCRQPDMRFQLVNEITKLIQSTWAKSPLGVTDFDHETVLLLAIELLAQEQQSQLQMQPTEVIELLYEVVSALDGTRPSMCTSELQQHPLSSDTDFWECLSKPCDPTVNFPLPSSKSPKNIYSVGMNGVEPSDFIMSPLDRLMQAGFAKVPLSDCTATSVISPLPIPTDLSFSSFGSYVMTTMRSNQQVDQQSKTNCFQMLERKLSNKSVEPIEFDGTGARRKAYSSLPLRRSRTRLSETQLTVLRSYFDINNSPSEEKLNEICGKTGLQSKVVKHWFRNTLFKERQRNKDNPYNFSIPPSTSLNLEEYEKTGRVEVRPAFMETYNADRDSRTRPPDSIGLNYEHHLTDSNPRLSNELDGINSTTGMPVPTMSEAGSEGFSLRNSDTDSSSITGFPLTPPAKRPSQNLASETPELLAVVNKRLCTHSKDLTNTLRGLYVATDFPDAKRDEYMLTNNPLTLAESTPPRTSPPNPRFTGSLGIPVSSDITGSLLSNSTQFPQPLEALVLAALNQRINPPPTELTEYDTPLDLSATGSQSVKFNTSLYPFSFGNTPNSRINTNLSISSSLVSLPSPSTLTIETSKPHQSVLPSTASSTAGIRRNRTSITVLQSRCMHSLYAHHKTPSVHECDRLGAMIGLTRRVVQVWFQNQRAKEKKMARVSSAYLNTPVPVLSSDMADLSQIDPTFCHMCCVPIRSEVSDSLLSVEQTLGPEFPKSTGSYTGNALTSHASFVDHLFSSTHLRNLVSWCSVETNNGHV
ncbi:hypothetical protein EG68_00245 [Paragonimus skrjabini miyazakii]|uniref:Zinc finger homeobox protein 3 n=1 Tax=Paragonimus skrjabini miyazakii TaxID=59628 RepID=A0A8S9Z6C8_9TREM|nr:hypothetical protein EG68_00245 [Paragonimus skrjabini miyazakii]